MRAVLSGLCLALLGLFSGGCGKSEPKVDRAQNTASDTFALQAQSLRLGAWVIAAGPRVTPERVNYLKATRPFEISGTFQNADYAVVQGTLARETEEVLAAIQHLLEEGADPNGVTVLRTEIARHELHDPGKREFHVALPSRRHAMPVSLVAFCDAHKMTRCAALLARHDTGAYHLAGAARSGDTDRMVTLLDGVESDPDARGILRGALLAAVRSRSTQAVKMMLDAGADPALAGSDGATPWLESILQDDPEVLSLLLAHPSLHDLPGNLTQALAGCFDRDGALALVAIDHPDRRTREWAVTRIQQPAALASVAERTHDERVRDVAAAVLRFGSDSELANHARTILFDENRLSRTVAVHAIQDAALLARVARVDVDPALRLAAIKKIADTAVLTDIARKDSEASVRIAAVEKLSDQTDLSSIAQGDAEPTVRFAVLRRLSDPSELARAAAAERDPVLRRIAEGRLKAAQMTGQDELTAAAITARDLDVARAAVDLLSDQELLAKIAAESTNWIIRAAALDRLTEQPLLAKLAVDGSTYLVRRAATERLTDPAVLAKIALEDTDWPVRLQALTKIDDPEVIEAVYVNGDVEPVLKVALKRIKKERVLELDELIKARAAGTGASR